MKNKFVMEPASGVETEVVPVRGRVVKSKLARNLLTFLMTWTHEAANHYVVIHPLDDVVEVKVDTENLGPMTMTTSVRVSLLSLRAYLVLMMILVLSTTSWIWPACSVITFRQLGVKIDDGVAWFAPS